MLNFYRYIKSAGFTLTEMLVSLAVSGILFVGLIDIFVSNLNHYQKVVNTNRLNQQLETTLDIMTDDIRRAGYWGSVFNNLGIDLNNNPFMVTGTDISVNAANNCILFTYDHNSDGVLPAISSSYDDERYGYRLNNATIQARPPGAQYSCSAASNAWENVTDPNVVNITNLSFTLNQSTITTGPGSRGVVIRSVDISLSGQLKSDATVSNTLTQHVRINNDKFLP